MLTGTLIEDLIATVERAQRRAEAEAHEVEELESWFAAEPIVSCSTELLGVA